MTMSFVGATSPPMTFTGPFPTGVAAGPAFGVPGNYFVLGKNNAASGNSVTLRMQWDAPVSNVQFRIADIDRNTSGFQNYIDEVTVAPTLAGSAVTGTFTPQAPPTTQLLPATATTGTTAVYEGSAAVDNTTGTQGSLLVSVPGPLDQLDISYASTQTGTGTTQFVALTDLFWTCPSSACPDSTSPIQLVTTCQNNSSSGGGCELRYTNQVYLRRESSTQTVQLHGDAAGTLLPYFDDVAVITVTPPAGPSVIWNVRSPGGTSCNSTNASSTVSLGNTRSGTCPNSTTGAGGADLTAMFGSDCGVFSVAVAIYGTGTGTATWGWNPAWLVLGTP